MSDDGRFTEGNTAALKHGARSYLARTEAGKPITVGLSEVERSVLEDLRANGPRGAIESILIRNKTANDLIWAAMGESPDQFASLLKMFCYTANNVVRAARDLAALDKQDGGISAGDVLEGLKREQGQ